MKELVELEKSVQCVLEMAEVELTFHSLSPFIEKIVVTFDSFPSGLEIAQGQRGYFVFQAEVLPDDGQ